MPLERDEFIKTLENTTRALSGNEDLIVSFGKHPAIATERIILPELPENTKRWPLIAAQSNRMAFIYRYNREHNLSDWLEGLDVTSLFAVSCMETVLSEQYGRKEYPGTVDMLDVLLNREAQGIENLEHSALQLVYSLSLLLREKLGHTLTAEQKDRVHNILPEMPKPLADWLEKIEGAKGEQKADLYKELLSLLQLDELPEIEQSAPGNTKPPEQSAKIEAQDDNDSSTEQESDTEQTAEMMDAEEQQHMSATDSLLDNKQYKIFTTAHDSAIKANHLVTEQDKVYLQEKYQNIVAHNRALKRKLSHKLRQYLLSITPGNWLDEQEEGVLDGSRLVPFIAGGMPLIYKQLNNKLNMDTVVTILVDNSGSMRGRPIEMAAMSTEILAHTLEQCGVKTEILGFTTSTWKGGKSRIDWLAGNHKENPGRLNDILHIVYKSSGVSYRAARKSFPVMLADDLLKENIDGEALVWAYKRLIRHHEKRKILVVISDGAPVDYATDRHNDTGYLDSHLRKVIEYIEKQKMVELVAIGIGHDVTRYYNQAITIDNPETLGDVMVDELIHLFKKSS
jgi:cobaltochelatase CobT